MNSFLPVINVRSFSLFLVGGLPKNLCHLSKTMASVLVSHQKGLQTHADLYKIINYHSLVLKFIFNILDFV